ncbi:MAG TPA: hypothetical protein PKN48_00685 [Bacteroidales bacterium]|nr:hypothetical protein [Bacteroidales bacterium]
MLTSHNIETQVSIENYDKNGNLKNIVKLPSATAAVSGEIECVIKNSDGTIASVHAYPMRSLVKNFFAFLSSAIGGPTPTTQTTSGGVRNDSYDTVHMLETGATYGQSLYGVMVGTGGATAVTPTQYALVTPVAHGTGAGQLEYFPTQTSRVVAESTDYSMYAYRTFTNSSAGSITVSEVGLYVKTYNYVFYYMIARDTVDYAGNLINLVVGVGQTLTVLYKFKIYENSGLTNNFANALHYNFIEPQTCSFVDTLGSLRETSSILSNDMPFTTTAVLLSTYGLVVGSGSSAMNIDSHCLDSKISTGTSAGNLYYGNPYVNGAISTATYSVVRFGRSFTNFTVDDVIFNEFAWYGAGNVSNQRCMMGRWLSGGITLSELESSQINISIIGYA